MERLGVKWSIFVAEAGLGDAYGAHRAGVNRAGDSGLAGGFQDVDRPLHIGP